MSAVPPTASCSSASSTAGPQLQALDRSGPRRAQTARSGAECSPPDLRRKLRIKAFPAGPPPRAWIRVLTGPQPQRISEDIPDRMTERMSEDMPDTYGRKNIR